MDLFLLEMGFAALILSFATTPGIFLLRWLMFRFMFMSGVVKLLSEATELVEPVGALVSLSHPAAAHASRLVRRADAGRPFGVRHRHDVLHRAGSTLLRFRPPPTAICRGLRLPLAPSLHPHQRQLQLVQSSDHAARLPRIDDVALRRILPARLPS